MVSRKPCKTMVKWRFRQLSRNNNKKKLGGILSRMAAEPWKPLANSMFPCLWHMRPSYLRWHVILFYMVSRKPWKPIGKTKCCYCTIFSPNPWLILYNVLAFANNYSPIIFCVFLFRALNRAQAFWAPLGSLQILTFLGFVPSSL